MVSGHLTAKRNRWYAVLNLRHPDGRRYSKWISTGLTIAGNKRKADERLQELRRQYSLGGDIHSSGILFTGYMSGWLKTIWPVVAATTYHSYQKLTNEICAHFEPLNLHLSEVTHSQIQDYYSWLFNRGLSSNSVLHYHAILHKAFSDAVKAGYITSSPMLCVTRPRKNVFVPSPYNETELKELFDCISGHPLELLIKLTATYGLRRSEVLGLRWKAFNFEKNTLSIFHTVYEEKGKKGRITVIGNDITKSKSSFRTLPLNEPIKILLLDYRFKKYGGNLPSQDSYLFTDGNGQIMKPSHLTASFSALLKKQGLRHIRFHDLRHASAGVLIANRVPLIEVQQWLGHSTIRITADLYSHLDYDIKLRSASIMKERLFDNEQVHD